MVIYKTTNLINNKIYIGQDSKNDPKYLGSGKIIKDAIKKYGESNFIKEILEECKTKSELDEREIYWINKLGSLNRDIGYNLAVGGNGPMKNRKHTNETKIKLSLLWKGKKRTQENKEKLSKAKTGINHTEETKEKISKAAKGRIPHNKGMKTSEETKEKQRLAKSGKKLTQEHVNKIIAKNKGRKNSEEAKANIKAGWEKRRNKKS
jgi:group I intron endonuclease